MGVGLVKLFKALVRLASGALCRLLMSMSEAFSVLFHCNKASATQTFLGDQAWSLILKQNLLWRSQI